MSETPSQFPNEHNLDEPCGSSWEGELVVDGRLPGRAFGAAFSTTIQPVVASVPSAVGRSETEADALRDKIQARINLVRDEIADVSPQYAPPQFAALSKKQEKALEWLLIHAEAEMSAALQLHDKWRYRVGGGYPLDAADTLAAFVAADCSPRGDGHRPVAPYGQAVVGVDGELAYCPSVEELEQRPKDRSRIIQHLQHALMHVRCAQYGLAKIILVQQAQEAIGAEDPSLVAELGVGKQAPPPSKPSMPHLQRFLELVLPDPDDLAPPEAIEEPPLEPPEGAEEPVPPPTAARPSVVGKAALVAGGVALGAILLRSWR
jgi:hypothetical protein